MVKNRVESVNADHAGNIGTNESAELGRQEAALFLTLRQQSQEHQPGDNETESSKAPR